MADADGEPHPDDDAVVHAVLAHLRAHPQAADSLHGVARWWVGDGADIEQVRRALATLVGRGLLRREHWADGTEWYCGSARPPRPGAPDPPLH